MIRDPSPVIGPARPALFLDRDGVLNVNRPDYVRRPDQLVPYPAALTALAQWRADYPVVVVTNQSGVDRGVFTRSTADAINDRLVAAAAAAGAQIGAVYLCPHTPQAGCACRKPAPGLLQQAARDLNLDLAGSIMIGDALTDIQAGWAAGVGRVALVRTGRGAAQSQLPLAAQLPAFPVFSDLGAALAHFH